jgi:peptidyl-prolyl cis-trans isomerase A (cyclophilin A)
MSMIRKFLNATAALLMGVTSMAIAQGDAAAGGAKPAAQFVRMSTSMGDIVLELNAEKAPISVENFLKYVDKGHYNGTIFHRVIGGFMIQGGGFNPDMTEKPVDAPIKNEWRNGLSNKRGTIAMARTAIADSATSQFFINVADNNFLDQPRDGAAYAVFGQVIDGMDTVDKIKAVKTVTKDGNGDVPEQTVEIKQVARLSAEEAAPLIEKAAIAAQEAENAKLAAMEQAKQAGIDLVKSKGGDVAQGITTPTGLWVLDTKVGQGNPPTVTSRVKVHYTGWLTDGTKFDSSVDRGQPAEFPLNGVIKGWTQGVGGMMPGGKRYMVIPPDMAYGASGRPPVIPQNAYLVFEVELLEVK